MVAYSLIGRVIGILGTLALPGYALYNLTTPTQSLGIPLILFFCGAGFVLGIVEIPMLCACYEWCKTLARITRPVAGLWVGRAIVHILITAGILGVGVHQNVKEPLMYVFGCTFIVSALCYLVGGLYYKEAPPFASETPKAALSGAGKEGSSGSSGGSSSSSAAEDAGGFFGRLLAKKAVENPAATSAFVGAAMGAAAPSAGALMFGGSGSSSSGGGGGGGGGGSKDNSPKESAGAGSGFYGDEEAPVDKASLFNGGGLFGGSSAGNNSTSAAVSSKSAKYGIASGGDGDDFEAAANPFMS